MVELAVFDKVWPWDVREGNIRYGKMAPGYLVVC